MSIIREADQRLKDLIEQARIQNGIDIEWQEASPYSNTRQDVVRIINPVLVINKRF